MYSFYAKIHTSENQYGNKINYCFVSKRLGGLIQKKKALWLYRYFDLKHFTMFDEQYLAILISSIGLILFVQYNEDTERHIEIGQCTELMNLFIKKNVKLSFMDLIKFSKKHDIEVDIKFK